MGTHPQPHSIVQGERFAVFSGSCWQQDNPAALSVPGLSPFSSGCVAEQHPGAQAHDGSIGQPLEQPLEQGIEEDPGLGGAAGSLFTLYLCSEVREGALCRTSWEKKGNAHGKTGFKLGIGLWQLEGWVMVK